MVFNVLEKVFIGVSPLVFVAVRFKVRRVTAKIITMGQRGMDKRPSFTTATPLTREAAGYHN
jgi:hypothetical protein